MKKALFIALKEVRDFLQDKGDLSFSLLLPVIIFALMYGAFGGSSQFNGTVNIVNEDAGRYSDLLIDRLGKYQGLSIQLISSEEADRKLSHSDIQMYLQISPDFSEKLGANQSAQLIFKQRGNGGTEGQIVASLVRAAAEGISQELLVQSNVKSNLADSGINPQQIEVTVQKFIAREETNPVITVKETLLGASPDPVNQFLPGILTMFVLFSINLTAQGLVEERRKGTLERLLTTRLTVGQLFAGKFMAYAARGFIQTLILLLLAYAVFGLFTPVSFLAALVLALIFAAAASTLGLIIGSIARTGNQATWISVFFTMFMVMISGTFMAISKGTALYTLSRFSLNTYANDSFRTIMNQGSLADAKTDILVMLGVAVVGILVSRLIFKVSQGGK
jgi:ABC-2 type transport system permease protein